jgi:hypothetical protein
MSNDILGQAWVVAAGEEGHFPIIVYSYDAKTQIGFSVRTFG